MVKPLLQDSVRGAHGSYLRPAEPTKDDLTQTSPEKEEMCVPNLPAENPTALLSLDELANFLNISRWAAYNLVSRRKSGIPALKIGREWRFRRSSIEQWISQIEGGRQ